MGNRFFHAWKAVDRPSYVDKGAPFRHTRYAVFWEISSIAKARSRAALCRRGSTHTWPTGLAALPLPLQVLPTHPTTWTWPRLMNIIQTRENVRIVIRWKLPVITNRHKYEGAQLGRLNQHRSSREFKLRERARPVHYWALIWQSTKFGSLSTCTLF